MCIILWKGVKVFGEEKLRKNLSFGISLEYDKIRTELLNSLRIKVLRFKNRKVMDNIEQILKEIRLKIKADNLD